VLLGAKSWKPLVELVPTIVRMQLKKTSALTLCVCALGVLLSAQPGHAAEEQGQAITLLQGALKADASDRNARLNLLLAYNQAGLNARDNPDEAIKYFREATVLLQSNRRLYDYPGISVVEKELQVNLDAAISQKDKNPRNFKVREEFGNECRKRADFIGAIVEYSEALKIKESAELHEKLADVYRVRDENDRAIDHYLAAAKIRNSGAIQAKLGSANCARKDKPSADTCYEKAMSIGEMNSPTGELTSGWENALKAAPEPTQFGRMYDDFLIDGGKYRPPKSIYSH